MFLLSLWDKILIKKGEYMLFQNFKIVKSSKGYKIRERGILFFANYGMGDIAGFEFNTLYYETREDAQKEIDDNPKESSRITMDILRLILLLFPIYVGISYGLGTMFCFYVVILIFLKLIDTVI